MKAPTISDHMVGNFYGVLCFVQAAQFIITAIWYMMVYTIVSWVSTQGWSVVTSLFFIILGANCMQNSGMESMYYYDCDIRQCNSISVTAN